MPTLSDRYLHAHAGVRLTVDEIEVASSLNFSILVECSLYWMRANRMRGFRKQYWILWKPLISWLLTFDLDTFHFI